MSSKGQNALGGLLVLDFLLTRAQTVPSDHSSDSPDSAPNTVLSIISFYCVTGGECIFCRKLQELQELQGSPHNGLFDKLPLLS